MQITSWENRRIIVSGSGGFIGSHLLRYFQGRGATVFGLSRKPRSAADGTIVDVTDYTKLLAIVKKIKPDAFFHLASEALVEVGQSDPYATFHNNIESALNVLEVCRKVHIQRIIIASTVHVYGDSPLPYSEDEPARPSRPYETSKTCVDLIAQSYADTFGLPVLIPRFVNIYGPGDTNMSRIVPKTISALLEGKQPTLWGGRAIRDYLYIEDALLAYDLLGKISDAQIERNRIFNFAAGEPVTAKKMIETIIMLMGKDVAIKKVRGERENEINSQKVNWSKAKNVLGWAPRTSLTDGLTKTIAWYQNNP